MKSSITVRQASAATDLDPCPAGALNEATDTEQSGNLL
jgi:hypothetical protein